MNLHYYDDYGKDLQVAGSVTKQDRYPCNYAPWLLRKRESHDFKYLKEFNNIDIDFRANSVMPGEQLLASAQGFIINEIEFKFYRIREVNVFCESEFMINVANRIYFRDYVTAPDYKEKFCLPIPAPPETQFSVKLFYNTDRIREFAKMFETKDEDRANFLCVLRGIISRPIQ
jgi:hypothetical protein